MRFLATGKCAHPNNDPAVQMASAIFFGVLNINKPTGMTSRRAVDAAARIVKPAKAGHAGTLDPLASGVLVVCVGPATRLIPHIQQQTKVYRGCFLLGQRSNTDDTTGEVEIVTASPGVTRRQIEDLLPQFVGDIEQVPPQFSAVHVDGQRAYQRARRGETVELTAKTVHVERISLLEFQPAQIELEIECGSGTYIRSIGRDLGDKLGCGAVMSSLVRTRIGPFTLETAISPEELDADQFKQYLLPATVAVPDLPQYVCRDDEIDEIGFGRMLTWRIPNSDFAVEVASKRTAVSSEPTDGALVALVTNTGQLAALARYRAEDQSLAPKQVFVC